MTRTGRASASIWTGIDDDGRWYGRLSVVIRDAPFVRDGSPVTVTLPTGRVVRGLAHVIEPDTIRVELPPGVS